MTEKHFLPWQVCRPLKSRHSLESCAAEGKRGTVILLNDYGAPFNAGALPRSLAARGFTALSYPWYLQAAAAKNFKQSGAAENSRYSSDFDKAALSAFLQKIVLPEYCAPFYLLAQGAGALFALSAHSVLKSAVNRMLAIAPVFTIGGSKAGSFYHKAMQSLGLFSAASYSSAAAAQASCAYRAHLLRQAAAVLEPRAAKAMALPCLLLIAGADSAANRALTRRFSQTCRLADIITLPAAAPDFLYQEQAAALHRQFWAIFDAFIPGSDASAANNALEHASLL